MQDQLAASNFLALSKKSFAMKFDLENTDYDSIENIGTGAYGVVCSAIHRRSNIRVAIKKIPKIFEQVTVAMRTYREIRILKHFKHSNIISIREILRPKESLDTFQDVYIVLDLMESDLHRIIYSPQKLTNEHIRWFVYQILRGLKYIHSANVVHRDLKPSNLLVNGNCDLKIGDFGMARGIYAIPDDANIKMTQYVATRWYRAPEIMLLSPTYTTGVDVWSVGCILAEMIIRKPLFPGKDFRHQLQMVFDVVGTPTESYVQMTHSDLIKEYLSKLPPKKSIDFTEFIPGATAKAVRLLQRFLSLDPKDRLTVDEALRDPYLSVHHEPDDEPVCVPPFDFSFEQEFKDMFENKELQSKLLRTAISKEISDYHRDKIDSVGDLGFLQFGGDDSKNITIWSSSSSPSKELDLEHVSINLIKESDVNKAIGSKENIFSEDDVAQTVLKIEISEAENQCDNELVANETEPQMERSCTHLGVNDLEDLSNDVRMLSAKLEEQCNISATELASVVPCNDATLSENQNLLFDMKAKIKAALLSKPRVELGHRERVAYKPRKAVKVQKEREEERRRKQEKALQRKKKKKDGSSPKGPVLTDEDRNLLERWQSMQKSSLNQTPPLTKNTQALTLPSGAFQTISAHDDIFCSPASTFTGLVRSTAELAQVSGAVSTLSEQFSTPERVIPSTPLRLPSVIPSFSRQVNGTDSRGEPTIAPGAGFEVSYGQPQHVATFSLPQNLPSAGNPVYWMSSNGLPAENPDHLMNVRNRPPSYTEAVAAKQFGVVQRHPEPVSQIMSLVGTSQRPLSSLDKCMINRQESQGFSLMGMESVGISSVLNCTKQEERDYEILPDSDRRYATTQPTTLRSNNPLISGFTRGDGRGLERGRANGNALDGLFQQTCLDQLNIVNNRLMKSNAEDLTLLHTPRGTGFGYGVGLDVGSYIMAPSSSDVITGVGDGPESAPVSATLMADWREVTGDMDANDFEVAIQEMGSCINFNDFNGLG